MYCDHDHRPFENYPFRLHHLIFQMNRKTF